jgi:hypothetical protein
MMALRRQTGSTMRLPWNSEVCSCGVSPHVAGFTARVWGRLGRNQQVCAVQIQVRSLPISAGPEHTWVRKDS